MARTIHELRELPVAAESGFAAGVAVGSLVGVIGNTHLPSYTAYTPTWTATGSAPAIGNSTVIGQYIQIGHLVHAMGSITFGNSATYGTGTYTFALPVAAAATSVNAQLAGSVLLYDTSATALDQALAQFSGTTKFQAIYGATYLGTFTQAGQTAPWTWATGDILAWQLTYEAA